MTFAQFAQAMTDSINEKAQKTADSLTTIEAVAALPEAKLAYQAMVAMAQAAQ